MKKLNLIILIALILSLMAVFPVFAQGETPPVAEEATPLPPTPVDGADAVKFGALLIAITAFFKKRFSLQENGVMIAAFFVGLFLWFAPQLANLLPTAAVYLNGLVQFFTVYLAAMGTVDFTINTGSKIATATVKSTG